MAGRRMRHDLHNERDRVRKNGYEHYGDEFLRSESTHWQRESVTPEQSEALALLRAYRGRNQELLALRREQKRVGRERQWVPTPKQASLILEAAATDSSCERPQGSRTERYRPL